MSTYLYHQETLDIPKEDIKRLAIDATAMLMFRHFRDVTGGFLDGISSLDMIFREHESMPSFISWDDIAEHDDNSGVVFFLVLACSATSVLNILDGEDGNYQEVHLGVGDFIAFNDYDRHKADGPCVALYCVTGDFSDLPAVRSWFMDFVQNYEPVIDPIIFEPLYQKVGRHPKLGFKK